MHSFSIDYSKIRKKVLLFQFFPVLPDAHFLTGASLIHSTDWSAAGPTCSHLRKQSRRTRCCDIVAGYRRASCDRPSWLRPGRSRSRVGPTAFTGPLASWPARASAYCARYIATPTKRSTSYRPITWRRVWSPPPGTPTWGELVNSYSNEYFLSHLLDGIAIAMQISTN